VIEQIYPYTAIAYERRVPVNIYGAHTCPALPRAIARYAGYPNTDVYTVEGSTPAALEVAIAFVIAADGDPAAAPHVVVDPEFLLGDLCLDFDAPVVHTPADAMTELWR
jgi:hypothetical protein